MKFVLDPLPYAPDALEPHISAKTLDFHYNKHHKGYLGKLEAAIKNDPLGSKSLEELVVSTEGGVFNNAAQVWNHSFYWKSLDPNGGGSPSGALLERLNADIGGIDKFRSEFAAIAAGQFGSGWAWLVAGDGGKLEILSTKDADNPMRSGKSPLLTLDVWEHAYYLDYQNDRPKYIATYLDELINWKFAEDNLAAAE